VSPETDDPRQPNPEDELIDIDAVCAEIGGTKPVSPATVYRHIALGRIDKPIHPTPGISRWFRNRIRAQARSGQ
jgi:hypothetical protein